MRILRLILGLLLIPVCVAVTKTILFLITSLGAASGMDRPVLAVGAGIVLWVALFYVMPRPVRTYVLAHELTHALWGSIFGARVSGLQVSKTGGSVKVSEVNWVTALAPYFFPLYTFLVILAYYLLALWVDLRRWELAWFGLIGLTLGFHWTFTLDTLFQPQSDILRYGRLFSYTLIYLLNLLGIGLVLMLVAPVTLDLFAVRLVRDVVAVWHGCVLALVTLWQGVGLWLGRHAG